MTDCWIILRMFLKQKRNTPERVLLYDRDDLNRSKVKLYYDKSKTFLDKIVFIRLQIHYY